MDAALLRDKAASASELLKVLANETRLLILCQLIEGEKPVNELEELVGIRQSALSQHLAILRRERLVSTRRKAQFVYYSLASEEAKLVMGALYQVFCTQKKAGA